MIGSHELQTWLTKLDNQHNQEIQLGLTRVLSAAQRLKLLNPPSYVITIGGTNGKGATVAALEAIYLAAGYDVASYTSPHLNCFNERIRLNKQPIANQDLVAAFKIIATLDNARELTYFETTTLAALWYFKQCEPAILLLEVGLGGRLDATNIIDSDLTIITTVAKDHEAYLGNTIELIAYEKAGIMRHNKPCIYADKHAPQSLINHAQKLCCQLIRQDVDYTQKITSNALELSAHEFQIKIPHPKFHPNSISAAIMAVRNMQNLLPVTDQALHQGLNNIHLDGRLHWLKTPKLCPCLIDVAHNPQAARYLANYLVRYKPQGKIYAIFSALNDKKHEKIIEPFLPLVDEWLVVIMSSSRAATAKQLQQAFATHGITQQICYSNFSLAMTMIEKKASSNDLILIFGTFLLVSEALSYLEHGKI
ncbi:MAG: bifunctional folylpolyglutamate synthase/dihydrofolate synthase [Legionellaceae bacterium]|nr:bifunctional folylpolyglutamate synthase/dihydrofolate synthase [Legionellaceae bacterium]HAF87506.1 bifunctional tetrahydrofolate synthase/dihydrofolate synthase [Legionellales bacterium]HCA89014.1 bifunctional tetrahydrofolate synthase/dihydrofolate synthase [Legionellales bacterium]|tara:strand:- start:1351 stop:2616 length:1266 start_codon:yes stop_codon:yes gene_type:complete